MFVSLPDYGDLCHKRECLFYTQLVSEIYEQKKRKIRRDKNEHRSKEKKRKRTTGFLTLFSYLLRNLRNSAGPLVAYGYT